jgi:alpha-beta hydrolase superfamily lysophospholipase
MGNRASALVEDMIHDKIYTPPRVDYTRRSCAFAKTKDGDSIAMKLYSENSDTEAHFCAAETNTSTRDLLILSHGNGSDIGHMHRFCEHLCSALDIDVLVYDYPQYGHSSGDKASEKKLCASLEAVFEACLQLGWSQTRMFLMGHSLGSVPTLHLASQPQCRVSGVILLAPLASGSRVFLQDSKYVPTWVAGSMDFILFNNMSLIGKVTCPIAIVHGTNDTVVSFKQSEALKLKVRESCLYPTLYVTCGHNDVVDVHSRDIMRITEYIKRFRQKCLLSVVHMV